MSSSLKTTFETGAWLNEPMLTEFRAWIKDATIDRLGYMHYNFTEEINNAINECLFRHTNKEYLECNNSLTKDLEESLIKVGIKSDDAIRLSWKWSD